MGPPADEVISAQVLLAHGCEGAETAQARFASLGFTVGPCVGTSFSITGRLDKFEGAFGRHIRSPKSGGLEFVDEKGGGTLELSRGALPQSFADDIDTVTFTAPPAFGPTNW